MGQTLHGPTEMLNSPRKLSLDPIYYAKSHLEYVLITDEQGSDPAYDQLWAYE